MHGGAETWGPQTAWDSTVKIFYHDPNSFIYQNVIWNPVFWPFLLFEPSGQAQSMKFESQYARIGGVDPYDEIGDQQLRRSQDEMLFSTWPIARGTLIAEDHRSAPPGRRRRTPHPPRPGGASPAVTVARHARPAELCFKLRRRYLRLDKEEAAARAETRRRQQTPDEPQWPVVLTPTGNWLEEVAANSAIGEILDLRNGPSEAEDLAARARCSRPFHEPRRRSPFATPSMCDATASIRWSTTTMTWWPRP